MIEGIMTEGCGSGDRGGEAPVVDFASATVISDYSSGENSGVSGGADACCHDYVQTSFKHFVWCSVCKFVLSSFFLSLSVCLLGLFG